MTLLKENNGNIFKKIVAPVLILTSVFCFTPNVMAQNDFPLSDFSADIALDVIFVDDNRSDFRVEKTCLHIRDVR